ncbi:hypothetical protein [Streptomyces sp. NPDC020817]|uniref:hypothetical protein n=1 Tax=Streptomyces sp. NPDC020817 TaxID=3365095 RepID=UPI00378F3EEC
MIAANRARRAIRRQRAAATRTARRAARALATGQPQPATVHLIGRGLDAKTAKRFAGAFSRGVAPTAMGETVVKLKGRARKAVALKLYDLAAFAARLAVYRPRDPHAAAQFASLAA